MMTEYVWRYAGALGDGERWEPNQKMNSLSFTPPMAKQGQRGKYFLSHYWEIVSSGEEKKIKQKDSPFSLACLVLQWTFPRVQILLLLKSPIIVRGTCNTGYFDGHNTQN